MAIIQINSKDPNFGFIIKKNPASGMQIRTIRQGTAFGWYSNDGTSFNILFKDADNAVSYGDQEFEFLNTSRYNSPLFVLNAIGEFLSSTVRDEVDIDTNGIDKSFIVNMVDIKHIKQIEHFKKYFENFTIETENYTDKSYKITVTTKESFNKLLNFINLMMLFVTLSSSNEYMTLDEASIEKYMLSIERLDAPFFIRYLFSRTMFRSKNKFGKYKERLETSNRYDNISMAFGDTAMQRRNVIEKIIPFDKPIVDIGCGEGFYAIPFAKKIEDKEYVAIDIVKELTDIVNKKAQKKELTNIKTYNDIVDFISIKDKKTKYDIILTEVIEHMPQTKSIELVEKVLKDITFDKFIVTVPNQEFNQFYMIDKDEFRHDDHDWEPTSDEFRIFMSNIILKNGNFKIEFIDIGDRINGISTSIGCVITK